MKFPFGRGSTPGWSIAIRPYTVQVVQARVLTEPVGSLRVEKVDQAPVPPPGDRRRNETLKARIGELLPEASGSFPGLVGVSLPSRDGVIRRMTLPTVRRDRIEDLLEYEIMRELPFDEDRRVVDYQPVGRGERSTRLILAAIRKSRQTMCQRLFEKYGGFPGVVETAPLSLLNFYRFTRPNLSDEQPESARALVHLGERNADLVVVREDELLMARTASIPAPADAASPSRNRGRETNQGTETMFDDDPFPNPGSAPSGSSDVDVKYSWKPEDIVRELQKTLQFVQREIEPIRVREVLVCGPERPGDQDVGLIENRLGVRLTGWNPASRVEGLDDNRVVKTLVPLGLSLRSAGDVAPLRLNLRSDRGGRTGSNTGRLRTFVIVGLVLLSLVQLVGAAYLRRRDRLRRLRITRRLLTRIQPVVQRVDRRIEQRETLRALVERTRRARSVNGGILSLFERFSRLPNDLRINTEFRRFRYDGSGERVHLSGRVGSYRQLTRLYRWLLERRPVVEILREDQRTSESESDNSKSKSIQFDVTMAVDFAPTRSERSNAVR